MATRIVRLLENFEREHGWRPELFSECGRYVTGPHGVLVTSVINEKRIYERYVGVDSGMQALMRPGMYGAYHHVDILDAVGTRIAGPLQRMNVVGAICENIDRFASNRLLPKNTKKGDLVVVHDTGAHGLAMGFNYNGRLRPQMLVMMPNGEVIQTRRAETTEDLLRTTVFPLGFKHT
jgi:diaminopimelate decarboxylase